MIFNENRIFVLISYALHAIKTNCNNIIIIIIIRLHFIIIPVSGSINFYNRFFQTEITSYIL